MLKKNIEENRMDGVMKSYDYLVTPYMSHKGSRVFLEEVADSIGAKLIFHSDPVCKIKLYSLFFPIVGMKIIDIKSLWFSSKQRQIRKDKSAYLKRHVAFLYFLRSFYYISRLECVVKNSKCLMLPTSEPYIEAFLIRYLAKKYNQKCFNYYSRNFVAIQSEPGNYQPSTLNFRKIISTFNEIKNTSTGVNNESSSSLTYSPGGQYTGCKVQKNKCETEDGLSDPSIDLSNMYVIFLHDFYDAPGIYGQGAYESLVCWFMETVRVLQKQQVRFLVKPHPNQLEQSSQLLKELMSELKLEKSDLINLDTSFILKQKPRAVISDHGSVLLEAAASNIPTVSSGISIASVLGIVNNSTTKRKYKKKLLMPERQNIKTEYIVKFLTQINDVEFEYKFNIPVIYSYSDFFINKAPKNDEDLRIICEKSDTHLKELKSSFQTPDYKRLIKILTE